MRFLKNSDVEHLKTVTSLALVNQKMKTFDPDGIFSPVIFGSDEYSCECGNLKAAWHTGEICEECGTTIRNPKDNIYRNGRFEIPNGYKVFNPTIYRIIKNKIKTFEYMIDPTQKHIEMNGNIIYDDEKKDLTLFNFIDFSLDYKETIEKMFKLIGKDENTVLTVQNQQDNDEDEERDVEPDDLIKFKEFLLENEDSVMLSSIPLLPLHLRPTQLTGQQLVTEPLNSSYIAINTHIDSLRNNVESDDLIATDKELYQIQKAYNDLYVEILELISSKDGIARDQILSNKINVSGRAVISVNHDNDPNSVIMPKIMFTELYFPKLLTKLTNYLNLNYTEATEYYFNNRFNFEDRYICMAIDDILLEKPMVIVNRNPSLHLLSIQAFYVSDVSDDYTLKVPKTCLQSFSGDFDGDTVAIFTLDTEEAKKEAEKLLATNNIISHKMFGINSAILPYQDDALGLWLFDYKNKK